ncbi:MAG TPA: hypothetical protein VGH99_03365 [Pseudonocardia sp.]|jgi:hypothetical protein
MADTSSTAGGTLRLEPGTIPTLRQAFRRAVDELRPVVAEAPRLSLAAPAMADGASVEFRAAFNRLAAGGPGSAAGSLADFERRLRAVVGRLDEIQRAYDRNESDVAAELTRRLGT